MVSESVCKTERLKAQDEYPHGVNSPTEHLAFKCFCGQGRIVEEHVWGFNDHIVVLECKECLKTYSSYMGFCGNGWIRYKK